MFFQARSFSFFLIKDSPCAISFSFFGLNSLLAAWAFGCNLVWFLRRELLHKDWTLHEALNSAGVWRCLQRTVELFVLGLNFESDDSRRDAINTRVPCQHFSVSSFNISTRAAKRTNGSVTKCYPKVYAYYKQILLWGLYYVCVEICHIRETIINSF